MELAEVDVRRGEGAVTLAARGEGAARRVAEAAYRLTGVRPVVRTESGVATATVPASRAA